MDGTLDSTFNIGTGFNGLVRSIALQQDGKIIVAGTFGSYNGFTVQSPIRLNSDGTHDLTFDSQFRGTFVKLLNDGKVLEETTDPVLIRLNSNGSIDTTFRSNLTIEYHIKDILYVRDGKMIVAGGGFKKNLEFIYGICRLDSTGNIDTTFQYARNPLNYDFRSFNSLALQADGKIVVGGDFTNYDGRPYNNLMRFNEDGTTDTTFTIGNGFDAKVNSIVIQDDGKIVAGGAFSGFDGYKINRIARIYAGPSTVNINHVKRRNIYTVFPNPTTSKIIIKVSNNNQSGYSYILSNIQGKVLEVGLLKNNTEEININYPKGVYFLTIKNSELSETKKIILQ